jgi:hypothetical protein
MTTFDELSGYRFSPGRDYDKKSVEIFRARSLDVVDGLLREITSLRNELSTRAATFPAGSGDGTGTATETAVPSWLSELEGVQPDLDDEVIELQVEIAAPGSELPSPMLFAAVESVIPAAMNPPAPPAPPAAIGATDDRALDTLDLLTRAPAPAAADAEWGSTTRGDSYSSW